MATLKNFVCKKHLTSSDYDDVFIFFSIIDVTVEASQDEHVTHEDTESTTFGARSLERRRVDRQYAIRQKFEMVSLLVESKRKICLFSV